MACQIEIGRCRTNAELRDIVDAAHIDGNDLSKRTHLRVFREGVQPIREDPANVNGGWALWRFSTQHSPARLLCAALRWANSSSDDSASVNGVVLSSGRRWGLLLAVWTGVPPCERLSQGFFQRMKSFEPTFICFDNRTAEGMQKEPRSASDSEDDFRSAAATPDLVKHNMFEPGTAVSKPAPAPKSAWSVEIKAPKSAWNIPSVPAKPAFSIAAELARANRSATMRLNTDAPEFVPQFMLRPECGTSLASLF